MMTFDDIYEILWDGTKTQIEALEGLDLAFEYTPSCCSFTIRYEQAMSREHKAFEEPNCVKIYGNQHIFKEGASLLLENSGNYRTKNALGGSSK